MPGPRPCHHPRKCFQAFCCSVIFKSLAGVGWLGKGLGGGERPSDGGGDNPSPQCLALAAHSSLDSPEARCHSPPF